MAYNTENKDIWTAIIKNNKYFVLGSMGLLPQGSLTTKHKSGGSRRGDQISDRRENNWECLLRANFNETAKLYSRVIYREIYRFGDGSWGIT